MSRAWVSETRIVLEALAKIVRATPGWTDKQSVRRLPTCPTSEASSREFAEKLKLTATIGSGLFKKLVPVLTEVAQTLACVLAERLQVCHQVVDIVVGVFPQQVRVRFGGGVDCE